MPTLRTSVSIIVEWYNATRASGERVTRNFAALVAQLERIAHNPATFNFDPDARPELIVTYNADVLCGKSVAAAIDRVLPSHRSFDFVLAAVPGGTYCRQKNHGAAIARRDVVVFLDSDLIPEPDWLAATLEAFRDPRIAAVVGNTYVDYSDGRAYSKALALTWMFPQRSDRDGLEHAHWFYANNLALRRAVVQRYPFEDVPGFLHAGARLLVERLERDQVQLWSNRSARASHPPPNGMRHFVKRAFAGGRARALDPTSSTPKSVVAWIATDCWKAAYHVKTILRDGRTVGLRVCEWPAAIAFAVGYDFLYLAGSAVSKWFPRWMQQRCNL